MKDCSPRFSVIEQVTITSKKDDSQAGEGCLSDRDAWSDEGSLDDGGFLNDEDSSSDSD